MGGRVLRYRLSFFEFFPLLLVLVIQHVILVSEMCRFKCILFHLSLELSDYHNWCKMPDYKYWTPTLFKKFTVLEKMGCWSLDLLPLAKFYDHVCSAVILISLTSVINRRTAVISLNALCPLVFEQPFVVSRLLRLFPVGIPWITIQCAFISSALAKGEHLYMKVPPGYDND